MTPTSLLLLISPLRAGARRNLFHFAAAYFWLPEVDGAYVQRNPQQSAFLDVVYWVEPDLLPDAFCRFSGHTAEFLIMRCSLPI